jgi:hypothetical protein
MERLDRDRGVIVACHEYHGRVIRKRDNVGEQIEPAFARHRMIDRDQIEALLLQSCNPRVRALGDFDFETPTSERTLRQTAQAVVVVDVEDPRRGDG